MLKIGLIGMRSCGRTSIFNSLAAGRAFPADSLGRLKAKATHISSPDPRLDRLAQLASSKRVTRSECEIIDFEGIGLGDGGGRQAEWLNTMQPLSVIVLVLELFQNDSPITSFPTQIDEAYTELIIADLGVVESRCLKIQEELSRAPRTDRTLLEYEQKLFERLQSSLEAGLPLSSLDWTSHDKKMVQSFGFTTLKPIVLALNTSEEDISQWKGLIQKVAGYTGIDDRCIACFSASLESEAADITDLNDRKEILLELGIFDDPKSRFIGAIMSAADQITVYTSGEKEARSWPMRNGSTALDFAATIHTDLARGFIRAETISFVDLDKLQSVAEVRKEGRIRQEGRDYLLQDGDVIEVLFSR